MTTSCEINFFKRALTEKAINIRLKEKNYDIDLISFGEVKKQFFNAINEFCPYSKVLVVAQKEQYLKYAPMVFEMIAECGCRAIGFVLDDEYQADYNVVDVQKVAKCFFVSEDYRAVVTFDGVGALYSGYIASVKGIACIHLQTDACFDGILSSKFCVRVGEKLSQAFYLQKKRIIIDEKLISWYNIKKAYKSAFEKHIALIDYQLNQTAIDESYSNSDFDFAKSALDCVLNEVFDDELGKWRLFYGGLAIAVANYLLDGEMLFNSSVDAVKFALSIKGVDYENHFLARSINTLYATRLGGKLNLTPLDLGVRGDIRVDGLLGRKTLDRALISKVQTLIASVVKECKRVVSVMERAEKSCSRLLSDADVRKNEKYRNTNINLESVIGIASCFPNGINGVKIIAHVG